MYAKLIILSIIDNFFLYFFLDFIGNSVNNRELILRFHTARLS